MKLTNIAAQLYTVREFTKTAEDLKETLRKIKEIGYAGVQVSAIGPIDPEQVKALADEYGLAICATHVSFDRLKNDIEQVIQEHKLWGCTYVGLGSIPQEYRGSAETYEAFVKASAPIVERLHEAGLQFVYHNHKFEFEKFADGRRGMDILFDETNAQAFGFELDLYWVHAGGANPADWIERSRGRMGVVHLKDMAIVDDQQVFAEIGEGNMNYAQLIEACRSIDVEWYIVEQDVCRRDPFESLAISFRKLQSLL
ncbi:sugar phosphate isomerase/epimerase [Paenibacillaceae bacterium]|nr:sugar phosphate isomerase/epimerase [Paenibacillaceae bacterium]